MYMNRRSTLCCVALLAWLVAGCVVVPHSQSVPPQRSVHDEMMRCRAENQQAHAEVLDIYTAAGRSGRISPSEGQQFNAMEARLRNYRADLSHDGLSLQDCQRIGAAIARERDEVARMARSDPGLGRCMADARRAHEDVHELYDNARRSGRINAREAQQFDAIEARIANLKLELARDGLSMRDCQRIHSAIAREHEEVARMAQQGPGGRR